MFLFGGNMYYTYILISEKDKKFYIGFTQDLKRRVREHKHGGVFATKSRLPVRLIFYEAYLNKYDALRREKYFKSTKGKTTLKFMLKDFLQTKNEKLKKQKIKRIIYDKNS